MLPFHVPLRITSIELGPNLVHDTPFADLLFTDCANSEDVLRARATHGLLRNVAVNLDVQWQLDKF